MSGSGSAYLPGEAGAKDRLLQTRAWFAGGACPECGSVLGDLVVPGGWLRRCIDCHHQEGLIEFEMGEGGVPRVD